MNWKRSITLYGVHCEGEVGRVITGGVIDVPGKTMLDKMLHINERDDALVRLSLFEPHGSAQMSANVLLTPTGPEAEAAFIVLQPDGAHALSGSNTMCVATVLLETGMVPITGAEMRLTLETPAGLIPVKAACSGNRVSSVTIDVCPSFAEHLDHPLDVEGLGRITVDVGFGGCYFALVDTDQLPIDIDPDQARQMVEWGHRIKQAVNSQIQVRHPEVAAFDKVEYVMFTSRDAADPKVYKNGTIIYPGRVDRSPCGTGSSSRMAILHAKGLLAEGEQVFMQSTIGGRFAASIASVTQVGGRPAVIPRLTGRCWIYSIEQHGIAPDDPFPRGYALSDTWGPDVQG